MDAPMLKKIGDSEKRIENVGCHTQAMSMKTKVLPTNFDNQCDDKVLTCTLKKATEKIHGTPAT